MKLTKSHIIMKQYISKEEFLKSFGNNVKKIRLNSNISYRKLAQRCDIDHSNLSKIEKGLIKIQLPTIYELAIGLQVHPKELFDFEIKEND